MSEVTRRYCKYGSALRRLLAFKFGVGQFIYLSTPGAEIESVEYGAHVFTTGGPVALVEAYREHPPNMDYREPLTNHFYTGKQQLRLTRVYPSSLLVGSHLLCGTISTRTRS